MIVFIAAIKSGWINLQSIYVTENLILWANYQPVIKMF